MSSDPSTARQRSARRDQTESSDLNMASATGIPNDPVRGGEREDEPLLGAPGAAMQKEDKSIWLNLVGGTATIAQAGIFILAAIVWGAIFSAPLNLVAPHPLLNTAALVFSIQAILVLQPTHTPQQKLTGTYIHSTLNNLATLSFLAGLIVIEYNKISAGNAHFYSVHGILGLIVYILLGLQALVGLTAFFTPKLYGSVANAKGLYKYHRASGYLVILLALANVCSAATVTYNSVLGIQLWAVIVASVIVVVGLVPRIRKSKLGF